MTMHTDDPKIALQSVEGLLYFPLREVLYASSEYGQTIVKLTEDREVKVLKRFKDFQHSLNSEVFCRINHSKIINVKNVVSYDSLDGKDFVIMLSLIHI